MPHLYLDLVYACIQLCGERADAEHDVDAIPQRDDLAVCLVFIGQYAGYLRVGRVDDDKTIEKINRLLNCLYQTFDVQYPGHDLRL